RIGRQRAAAPDAPGGVEIRPAPNRPPAVLVARVADPFPNVAGQLLGTAGGGALGMGAHRHRPAPTRLHAVAPLLVERVAPGPRPAVAPARRRLPFIAAGKP